MTTARNADHRTAAWKAWHAEDDEIRIGISSCLLGQQVRFDGGHKRDRYLTDVLGHWVKWVSVCPEIEIGLGIPRPTIRLNANQPHPQLIEPKLGTDLTDAMASYSVAKVTELQQQDLDGYVLKKGSPSCGMERVRVYSKGSPMRNGIGVYARILMERWPHLPVEEEGRLNDPVLRENFIERVFCRHRWRSFIRLGPTRGRLVEFHTAHKLLLSSHNEASYRRLGRIVASAGTLPDSELLAAYEAEFHLCLTSRTTSKRHSNVLFHVAGYLKRVLDAEGRRELNSLIEDYRAGLIPLVVPVTLLRHLVHHHDITYLKGQLYLEPHPKELMLRNRV